MPLKPFKRVIYYPRAMQFALAAKAIAEARGYKSDTGKWTGHDTRMSVVKGMVFLPLKKTFGWGPITDWPGDIDVDRDLNGLVGVLAMREKKGKTEHGR